MHPFEDDIESLHLIRQIFDTNKMTEYFKPVMEMMWDISSKAPNFRPPLMESQFYNLDLKDWNEALSVYGKAFEDPQVVHVKYSDKKMKFQSPLI